MHLPGVSWAPATLCIYTLVQSSRPATSLLLPAGVLWTLPTSCLKLSRSSSSLLGRPSARDSRHPAAPSVDHGLEQPKRRRLEPEWISRVGLLRGGADASAGVVSDGSTENRSSLEDTIGLDVGVDSSAASEEAAEKKRSKRWLLKATEHDRSEREGGPSCSCTWRLVGWLR